MEQTALVYTMVLMSAVDRHMRDSELYSIGEIVRTLPVFDGFDPEMLPKTAEDCASLLGAEGGLDTVVDSTWFGTRCRQIYAKPRTRLPAISRPRTAA